MTEKAGWRPRRFDVAGAHPDEVYGAVGDLVKVANEVGHAASVDNDFWRDKRPMRFADNLDGDVKQFLAAGVGFIDRYKNRLPLGLSRTQQDIRDHCEALAISMEKVLAKRVRAEQPGRAWQYVKVKATPVTPKQPGQTALSVEKTVQAVKEIARSHFEDSAWKAGMAQRAYREWAKGAEEEADITGAYPPMSEDARSWHFFMKRADDARVRSALKGEHWAQVDVNEGIDFAQVMNFRATYRPGRKPRMRM